MRESIPITIPDLGESEAQAASQAILSGWVTQGPRVAKFEEEFATAVGAHHAVAVSNCTVALHLALKAVGVKAGSEVITVSHSFIATVNAVTYLGATPFFVDIEAGTGNLNPALLEEAINEMTSAILVVHQVGMPANLSEILRIARKHNIPVVEDAACAVGSEVNWDGEWQRIGKPHGEIACFSFHPRKLLTTGDGGMLTTNNEAYAEKFRLWRQHGMSVPDTVRHKASSVVFEEYVEVAYNYRMTDIQAAVGREQLKRLDTIVETRRKLALQYNQMLTDIPGIELPIEPDFGRSNYQTYLVRLPKGVDQKTTMQELRNLGISTRRGIMCAHREPAYQKVPWKSLPSGLKQSEVAQDEYIAIPLFSGLTEEEQRRVVNALKQVLAGQERTLVNASSPS